MATRHSSEEMSSDIMALFHRSLVVAITGLTRQAQTARSGNAALAIMREAIVRDVYHLAQMIRHVNTINVYSLVSGALLAAPLTFGSSRRDLHILTASFNRLRGFLYIPPRREAPPLY